MQDTTSSRHKQMDHQGALTILWTRHWSHSVAFGNYEIRIFQNTAQKGSFVNGFHYIKCFQCPLRSRSWSTWRLEGMSSKRRLPLARLMRPSESWLNYGMMPKAAISATISATKTAWGFSRSDSKSTTQSLWLPSHQEMFTGRYQNLQQTFTSWK